MAIFESSIAPRRTERLFASRPWLAHALGVWVALLLCACGGSDGHGARADSRDAGGAREGGSSGASTGNAAGTGSADGGTGRIDMSIGVAGGTVAGPDGAVVEVPAGALSHPVDIGIERSSAGAPPLPEGFTPFGAIYAFTPHGTQFAAPVTVTLPFDAALVPDGGKPSLYKTNAAHAWEQVDGAAVHGDHVTAEVTGFSWFVMGDPGLLRELPIRTYAFRFFTANDVQTPEKQNPVVIGGLLDEHFDFGKNDVFDVDHDGTTSLEVHSSADGRDFWASADAPSGNPENPNSIVAGEAELVQQQSFIKAASSATLQFVVKEAFLEAVDFNGDAQKAECPWGFNSLNAVLTDACDVLRAEVAFTVRAYDDHGDLVDQNRIQLLQKGGYAELRGHSGGWFFKTGVYTSAVGLTYGLWSKDDFDFTQDLDGSSGREHPRVALSHPITMNVDLSSVKIGHEFTVASLIHTSAYNRRGRESGIGAYLRDPSKSAGASLVTTGLVETNRPLPPPTDIAVAAPACTPGSNPAAGVLALSAAAYAVPEQPFTGDSVVEITRTGGSSGEVSATLTVGGGDAVPGKHYTPFTTTVVFPDGDTTPRTVPIEILLDADAEPDRTVNLTLSDPGGCATLGDPSTAVLTILDDDHVVTVDTFSVGGTVSGLEGKGLVLTSLGVNLAVSANGAFVLPRSYTNGSLYDLAVQTEPRDPDQACLVENGRGTVPGADVKDIRITCTSVGVDPALDPSFGVSGVVSTAFGGGSSAMVLQPDGKIVVAGGSVADFVLARYLPDGSLDPSFGASGLVKTDFGDTTEESAHAVALQPDGKIVVAGYAVNGRTANNQFNYDFAVVRYRTDGSLDPSFGSGGKVTTDFAQNTDRAAGVAIQSDGRIIVVGDTSFVSASGLTASLDFGVVRYMPDGSVDSSFGSGGKLTTDIGGSGDFAHNVVVQTDGKIVVSGSVGLPGDSSADHTGVSRYGTDGKLDASFGTSGKVLVRDRQLGEALALQGDGKLLVAGTFSVAGVAEFALMRLTAGGSADPGFGTAGLVTTEFSTRGDAARDIAVQADGKILVAGQTANVTNSDFAVARYGSDGKLDASFGTGGKLVHDFFGGFDGAESVAVQGDGKVVVSGFARNGASGGYGLIRTAK
jgi:uncharacterized delta-60 repeat protein